MVLYLHKATGIRLVMCTYPIINTGFVYPFGAWAPATDIRPIVCICVTVGLKLAVCMQADAGTSYKSKPGGGASGGVMPLGLAMYIFVATKVDCEHVSQ